MFYDVIFGICHKYQHAIHKFQKKPCNIITAVLSEAMN